jgi:hypothetical protein
MSPVAAFKLPIDVRKPDRWRDTRTLCRTRHHRHLADAAWLANAATEAQQAKLDGRDPRTPDATWADTPEGVAAERAEKAAALKRHEERWGTRPA